MKDKSNIKNIDKKIEKAVKKEVEDIGKNIKKEAEKAVEKEIKELGLEGKIVKKKFSNEEKAMIGVIIILAFSLLVIFYPNIKNIQIKPSISITEISGCEDCFDVSLLADSLAKDDVKISSRKIINYDSNEARKLIEKYKLNKIPALVVKGGVDKLNLDKAVFRIEGKTAIFDKPVPYFDLALNQVKGKIKLKEVFDSSCKDCSSLSNIKTQLEKLQVKIDNYEMIDSKSEQGKLLINENKISYLPSLLVSKEINEYWWVFDNIKNSFSENNEYYRFAEPTFPAKEISSGLVKGKVKITYVTNNSCEDCFNVTQLKSSFQSLGVYVDGEEYVDISSEQGKSLLKEYNITAIPTLILSEEISDYTTLKKILEGVGSFVNKKYVFRKLNALNVKYQEV